MVTPYDKKTVDTPCVGCGQCVQVCPVGALTIHDDTDRIYKELINGKILVAQVAPSVRVTIAEALGEDPGTISPGRLVTAMKSLDSIRYLTLTSLLTLPLWKKVTNC